MDARFSATLLALLLLAQACNGSVPEAVPEEVMRLNARGTAHLGRLQWGDAATAFRQALASRPDDPLLLTNLALTEIQLAHPDEAVRLLEQALAADAAYPPAHYNLALIAEGRGDAALAVEHLTAVARIDPTELHTQYYLGSALARLGRDADAERALESALASDPTHVSSLYALGRLLIKAGRQAEGVALIERSQQIRARSGLDEAAGHQYGEQGPYAMGADYAGDVLEAPAATAVRFRPAASRPAGAWALTRAGEGGAVVAADARGLGLLSPAPGGAATTVAPTPLGVGSIAALAAGDVDNDRRLDLVALVDGRLAVLLQDSAGAYTWQPAIDALAGSAAATTAHAGLTLVDRDHDGDLDAWLCAVDASGGRCALGTNDGAGRFTVQPSSAHGFDTATLPVGRLRLAFSDADNDRDVDLLVSGRDGTRLYANQRDGNFEDVSQRVGLAPGTAGAVSDSAIADLNKDGWMDLVTAGPDGVALRANRRGRFEPAVVIHAMALADGATLVVLDADNDGFLDVVCGGASGSPPLLLRNLGRGRWEPTPTAFAGAGAEGAVPLAALDADADGDLDLLVQQGAELRLLANEGGNAQSWIALDSRGVGDNRFGVGAKVEILAGGLRQKFEITVPLPVHCGLGPRQTVESARYVWPSGVLQDEVDLAARRLVEVAQLDRKGTSCPLLYAWRDGGWRFVTDLLGGSAIGYQVAPGVFSVPDTDEYVAVPGGLDENAAGELRLRLNNQLEEVIWFDAAELIVVDHPAGTELFPGERLLPGPPFPPFALYASSTVRSIDGARALDPDRDVTALLAERDGSWVEDFALSPFKGYARAHTLELDLGRWAAGTRAALLLDGWVDYADSSANVAAGQAGVILVPPRVAVIGPDGGWIDSPLRLGFPAGLPRTLAVDVTDAFPTGDHRLRIETSMRIYWDRARVMLGGADVPLRVQRLKPAAAELRFGGFPRELRSGGRHVLAYDPASVAPSSTWKTHAGRYTPFGDVRSLLAAIDDRFVTTRNGDEIELTFTAPPPPAAGLARSYLLYADGFGKDMDLNSAASDRVAPMPFHAMPSYPYPADVLPPVPESTAPVRARSVTLGAW